MTDTMLLPITQLRPRAQRRQDPERCTVEARQPVVESAWSARVPASSRIL